MKDLASREKRVEVELSNLRAALSSWLKAFHRDAYKTTDRRLQTTSLAQEILIFDKLGYDLGSRGARFLLGVDDLLEGRHQSAIDLLSEFVGGTDPSDPNLGIARYLSGMIS